MHCPTSPQTVGPFFAILVPERGTMRMVSGATSGARIVVDGSIADGAGTPVPDALIEVWQANSDGQFHHPDDPRNASRTSGFEGFGRIHADATGSFSIETLKPGPVPGPGGAFQAPHLLVGLFARGLLTRLVTRIYFDDEPTNADDPILARVPPARRRTLIARQGLPGRYRLDIVLQGRDETVFFDV